jgi:hypothetical protein
MDIAPKKLGNKRRNITVAVRVRPLNKKEEDARRVPVVRVNTRGVEPLVQITRLARRGACLKSEMSAHWEYGYDCAFGPEVKQEQVYNETVRPLIGDLLGGINSTVFAYGATGSGKTHTMMGYGNGEDSGVIPRALSDIFRRIEHDKAKEEDSKGPEYAETKITVELAYMEVYNEKIYDLLNPGNRRLEPREDPAKGIVIVAGLERRKVQTEEEVMKAVVLGNAHRKMEATAANKVSSRSHAVLQVFVTKTTAAVPGKSRGLIVRGVMNLIDLAGSERASNTQNRGMRLTEGAAINKSLLALANCINALALGRKSGQRVKYRDSKLTHLLKSSLEGNCAMVMIAAINPSNHTFEESHNTLKYADRAKTITIKATAHEQAFSPAPKVKAAHLKDENAKLKAEIEALKKARTEALKNKKNVISSSASDTKINLAQPKPPMEKRREAWQTSKNPTNMGAQDVGGGIQISPTENRCDVQKRVRRNRVRRSLQQTDVASDASSPASSFSEPDINASSSQDMAVLSMTNLSDAPSITNMNISNVDSMSEFAMPHIEEGSVPCTEEQMVHQYDIYKALAAETHNEELKKAKTKLVECKKTIQEQAIENEGLVLQLDDMKKKEETKDELIKRLQAEIAALKKENADIKREKRTFKQEKESSITAAEVTTRATDLVSLKAKNQGNQKRKSIEAKHDENTINTKNINCESSGLTSLGGCNFSLAINGIGATSSTVEHVNKSPTKKHHKQSRGNRRKSLIPIFIGRKGHGL